MKSIELERATEPLKNYIHNLGKEPLLVSIQGTPVAVLTPIAELEALSSDTSPDSLILIRKSLQQQPSGVNAPLATHVRRLGREPAIVGFEGKPLVVLVAIADIEAVSLSCNPRFLEIIEQSRQQQQAGKVSSSEEVRRKLGF